MKTTKIIYGAALLTLAASCAQDDMELDKIAEAGKPTPISYKVDTDKMTRATSAFENGTDVNTINVSAWVTAPKKDNDGNFILDEDGKYTFALPGYGSPNIGNASFFTNDVLTRSSVNGTTGTFNYQNDARYWPNNNEILDFYALVDNEKLGTFTFQVGSSNDESHPGIAESISQGNIDEMPDMLFATTFNQKKAGDKKNQQNVSFHFNHAFAKVVVTAQVKNKNLRVMITDLEIHGIRQEGKFFLPYKSGKDKETVVNPAYWTVKDTYGNLAGLLKFNNEKNPVVLDMNTSAKATLLGETGRAGQEKGYNDLLVLPSKYDGRNGNGKYQTYIQLKGYAYNIAGETYDEDTDALIYGEKGADGPVPMIMIIPIEFDWKMGTVNTYNITFDCGNGGSTSEDPNNPAFVRIGYEVEVRDWVDVNHGDFEYKDDKTTNKKE